MVRQHKRDQRSHLWEPGGGGTHTKRRQGRTDSLAGGTRRSELMLDLEFRRSKSLAGGVDLLDLMGGTAGGGVGKSRGRRERRRLLLWIWAKYDYSPPF
ncbi:hypothetical protein GW17_00004762, partial [Ensete ventricosum]